MEFVNEVRKLRPNEDLLPEICGCGLLVLEEELLTLLKEVPLLSGILGGGNVSPGGLLCAVIFAPFVELDLPFKLLEDILRDTLGIPNAGDGGRLDCGDCKGGVDNCLFDFDDVVRVGGLIMVV